jgi:hypothetical protein
MNVAFILKYRDAIYIAVILLLILFRSSDKSQKNDIIQHENKVDSIQFEIKQAKTKIPDYEKVNLDSINNNKPNELELFFAKRYNHKNSN